MKELNRLVINAAFVALAAYTGLSAGRAQGIDQSWLNEKKEILRHLSIVELDDGAGGKVKTIRVTGVNLQIVNGLGATNGNPSGREVIDKSLTKTNGVGNLIVGYNEVFFDFSNPDRTGSHNLVGGVGSEYSSFGGIVFGRQSRVNAPYASVMGGVNNKARGEFSVVVGGGGYFDGSTVAGNIAEAAFSTIVGGATNLAGSQLSFIGGGLKNRTGGTIGNSILGGSSNVAAGSETAVCGGIDNRSAGRNSHVCGGEGNVANGNESNVGGGLDRKAMNQYDWRAGDLLQEQ